MRNDRRLQYRLKKAQLRQNACVEDLDYRQRRGLDKAQMQPLLTGRWLNEHLNCLITGPTGVGKTLDRLCLGQSSVPARLQCILRALATVTAGSADCQSRRALPQTVTRDGQNPVTGH